jgi:hypothetical protein
MPVFRSLAVARPQGALAYYAHAQGKLAEIGVERSLIIDPARGPSTGWWRRARGWCRAESVTKQAVSSIKEWIEAPHSLQNIILVDGGAFLFRKAVKAALSCHRTHETREPVFANVRGFQLAGMTYARTGLSTEGERAGAVDPVSGGAA